MQYGLERWVEDYKPAVADFSGLDCRWNPMKSSKDKILTLMVLEREVGAYEEVMKQIMSIYGDSRHKPVTRSKMSVSLRWKDLKQEYALKSIGKGIMDRMVWGARLYAETLLGVLWFRFDFKLSGVGGQQYVSEVISNTDYQKFDDTLRVILDSSNEEAEAMQTFLEAMYQSGKIFYGITLSSSLMMTCLIFERSERHLHFVDGMDGGYTLAAKAMKAQMGKQAF